MSKKSHIGSRIVAGLVAGLALTACAPMTPQQEAMWMGSINRVTSGHYVNGVYHSTPPIKVIPVKDQ
jgi:outer membrane PBP1 activator LpoA protein